MQIPEGFVQVATGDLILHNNFRYPLSKHLCMLKSMCIVNECTFELLHNKGCVLGL